MMQPEPMRDTQNAHALDYALFFGVVGKSGNKGCIFIFTLHAYRYRAFAVLYTSPILIRSKKNPSIPFSPIVPQCRNYPDHQSISHIHLSPCIPIYWSIGKL